MTRKSQTLVSFMQPAGLRNGAISKVGTIPEGCESTFRLEEASFVIYVTRVPTKKEG